MMLFLRAKLSKFLLLLLLLQGFEVNATSYEVTSNFRSAGYWPPVAGQNLTNTNYDFMSSAYRQNWGTQFDHAGIDIVNAHGQPVYAIAAGVVVRVSPVGTGALDTAVVVRHTTRSGIEFQAIYGHTIPDPSLSPGVVVHPGQVLGTTTQFATPSHIHFGINTNSNFCSATGCSAGWGRVPLDTPGSFVDPIPWLSANPVSIIPSSLVDGVGSLVDPSNSGECSEKAGFGCVQDEAMLQRHSLPSSAVFQVYRKSGTCEFVELSGLQQSYISVRGYADTIPLRGKSVRSTVYIAKGNPVRIPLMGTPWQLVTVTTTVPLPESSRTIRLKCVAGTFGSQPAGAVLIDIAPEDSQRLNDWKIVGLPLADGKGYAGGVGSILPYSRNADANDVGRYKDVALTQYGSVGETYFQVMRRTGVLFDICKNITISGRQSNGDAVATAISFSYQMKRWSDPTWGAPVSAYLPARIPVATSDQWWLIKVSGAPNQSHSLRATCN